MSIFMRLLGAFFFALLFLSLFASYENDEIYNSEGCPLDNGGRKRNIIVVMSDMHLGANLNYAEYHIQNKTTMNFVVVTSKYDDYTSQTMVTLINFENEIAAKMNEDSLCY